MYTFFLIMRKIFMHVSCIFFNVVILHLIKKVYCARSSLYRQIVNKKIFSRSCTPSLRMGSKSESATEFTLTPQVHHDAGSPYYDAKNSESKIYQGTEIAFQGTCQSM